MASSWKITRGVTRNRVRQTRAKRIDPSPTRAKIKQRGTSETIWTTISIVVKADDLTRIDDCADACNQSRSAFLINCALEVMS
jgi:hypothetical protein